MGQVLFGGSRIVDYYDILRALFVINIIPFIRVSPNAVTECCGYVIITQVNNKYIL